MKLGILVNNQEILQRIYRTKLDGKRALKLRKTIKKLNSELETFNEARNDFIKEHGSGDPPQIKSGTQAYTEFLEYFNEMAESEVEDPEPILTETDLGFLGDLSIEDIDHLEALGLLKCDEEEKKGKKKEVV